MSLLKRNEEIAHMFQVRIAEFGLGGKLEFDPIQNTFKRRNPYTKRADGVCVFTGFMWQMNKLSQDELMEEIDRRILNAANHFGLEAKYND